MIEYIKTEMHKSITTSTWMEQATKHKALEKLKTFKHRIGYPDVWRDHSILLIHLTQCYMVSMKMYWLMWLLCSECITINKLLDTVDKSQDPNKWGMIYTM